VDLRDRWHERFQRGSRPSHVVPDPRALVFGVHAFVSAASMPGPLKWFAEHQPVSILIDAVRSLTYGGIFHDPEKVLAAVIWTVAIIAIAAPWAVRIYRRKV